MDTHELEPVDCTLTKVSPDHGEPIIDNIIRLEKRKDAGMGEDLPSTTSQIPSFVLARTTQVACIEQSQVE